MMCGSEDLIMQGTCKEWVWEYVLKHCSNNGLIRALAEAYPVPDSSLHLKRMLLLKSLSFNLSEDQFSDRTLETIRLLLVLYRSEGRSDQFHVPATTSDGYKTRVSFTLKDLHLAVSVECIVQHLRREADNWPKFCEALEKHWGEYAEDTQEPEDDAEFGDKFLKLKEELWAVQKQPELRHDLLKKRKRGVVKRMMQSFLSDAWEDVGSVFLEDVAENLKKGLYVSHVFSPIDAPSTNKGLYVAGGSSPERPIDAYITKNLKKGLYLPHGSSPERPIDASIIKDPRTFFEKLDIALVKQKQMQLESPQLQSKRKIPATLKERRKERVSLNSNTEDQQLVEEVRLRVLSAPPFADRNLLPEGDTMMTDASSPSRQKLQNSIKVPAGKSSKGACLAGVEEESSANQNMHEKVFLVMPTEQRDEFAATPMKSSLHEEEEEPTCPSPPPWAGSPGLDGNISLRSKRRKLGPFYPDESDAIKMVATVCENAVLDTPEILKAQSELKEGQASLNAVVKDPLPEAMKIAAKASEFVRKVPNMAEQTLPVNGGNQGVQSLNDKNNIVRVPSSHLEGGAQVHQEKPSKRSIMDRNPTAQTIEWENSDDIADSSDDKSPSRSRRIHLPRLRVRQSFAQPGGIVARNQPQRRKFKRWTQAEENILRKEVERYGKGQWKHILQKHSEIFENRTEVDLKDKWRNIERGEGIL